MNRKKKDESGTLPRLIGLPFALGMSLLYLLISGFWIFFSDRLAEFFSQTANQMRFISTYKGWFFVFITSALLFLVLNRFVARIRRAQQQLCENEERLKIATEAGGVGIWDRDIINDRLVWDDRMYKLYGVHKEDFGGAYDAWVKCLHPDDLERAAAEVLAAESGEKPFDTEFRVIRPDGEVRHIRAFGKVIRDGTGRPVRMTGTNQDVTSGYQAQEKLQEREEELSSIIEHSTNMFYSHTPDHVLTYVSPQVKKIIGYEVNEALLRWTELTTDHPVNEPGFQLTEKAIRTGKPQPAYELQLMHKDGHPVWVEVREAPIVENGKTVAIVGSLNDITDRKEAEAALKQKMEELARFNKAAVGRELRMIELKKEINALCRELGREEPYKQEGLVR